jgi:small subunit ribosomal protein S17
MATETTTAAKKGGRTFRGTVVSAKMKDTVAVLVSRYVKHPKYKKFRTLTKKFLAHDAGNTKKEGEVVTIRETRPMSKRKHFEVVS